MPFVDIAVALVVAAVVWWFANTRIGLAEQIRTIVNIVVVLMVVGILLWLINMYVPMAPSIKAILNIVVVVATCVFVLKAVGLWGDVVEFWHGLVHRTERAMDRGAQKNP